MLSSRRLSIFLVEDNLADVLLVQEALNARQIPAALTVVSDGERALKELAALNPTDLPNLVILDLNLPRVNGWDILRKLRSAAKFAHSAILILTSSQIPSDRVEAERLGADAFVSKPIKLDDFLQRVGATIERLVCPAPEQRHAHRVIPRRRSNPPVRTFNHAIARRKTAALFSRSR
jgi:DNA-binding response OmpR family regulator